MELVPLNDARSLDGKWDPEVELANARSAVEDMDAMIYIGPHNSGAARLSTPVLNRAGMAMISPGNTYPALTKPGTGNAGEPSSYYPLGPESRNYFRVVPADDLQGAAAAAYAREMGISSVYVLHDAELYGQGVAQVFATAAFRLGMRVLADPEAIDVRSSDYSELAGRILALGPNLVYFGGLSDNHAGLVLRDLRAAGYHGVFMGADGIVDSTFTEQAQQGMIGVGEVYATLFGQPATELTGDGADWYRRYKHLYPDDFNENLAPYGYEAGKVALHAIAMAGRKDREAIRAAVAATSSADLPGPHILGNWSFDGNGDTSFGSFSVLKQSDRGWSYLCLMSYDLQNPENLTCN